MVFRASKPRAFYYSIIMITQNEVKPGWLIQYRNDDEVIYVVIGFTTDGTVVIEDALTKMGPPTVRVMSHIEPFEYAGFSRIA